MNGQERWMRLAERAAAVRARAILDEVEAVIEESAADVAVERTREGLRLRGRHLVRRWITEAAFRFVRSNGR